jgi:drug/metabolite transporter (DMT)-like permease
MTASHPAGAAMTSFAQPKSEEHQNVVAGIGLMLFAVLMFSANDVLGKWLVATYSVGQVLLFRSAAAWIVLSPLVARAGPKIIVNAPRPWLQFLRVLLSTGEVACFYLAVTVLPLADTMTYYLATPIYVTLLAALILKERVGWRRWSAVLVGFVGVLIALQPSSASFGWPALVALLGSVLFAFLMIVTRTLRGTPDLTMVAWQFACSLIVGLAWAPFQWVPFNGYDMFLIGLVGVVGMLAMVCVNRSLKLAPASVVVPYQYTMIVWAVVFGYLVFGDVPSWAVVTGATIIIAAGLYIFFREQRVAKQPEPELLTER